LGRSLAAHCWRLHQAAEAGDRAAERRLYRLGRSGVRAGQCMIDLVTGSHRHPGCLDACDDMSCTEASDGAAWAASWELYWPPGQHPGTLERQDDG
jgi:hypothetical protein